MEGGSEENECVGGRQTDGNSVYNENAPQTKAPHVQIEEL